MKIIIALAFAIALRAQTPTQPLVPTQQARKAILPQPRSGRDQVSSGAPTAASPTKEPPQVKSIPDSFAGDRELISAAQANVNLTVSNEKLMEQNITLRVCASVGFKPGCVTDWAKKTVTGVPLDKEAVVAAPEVPAVQK